MKEKILASGAEALIIQERDKVIKRRIKKSYRIPEIDERLRKRRTRAEGKIMDKLGKVINCPKIIKIDEKNNEIIMEFISGEKLSENLDKFGIEKAKEICYEIGKAVVKIHNSEIVHGDLTTSNMILKNNDVFFIDFGLGFHSSKIEDKAVDLHLFKQALESRHFRNFEIYFERFVSAYKENGNKDVLKQLEKVEKRGRYKGKH